MLESPGGCREREELEGSERGWEPKETQEALGLRGALAWGTAGKHTGSRAEYRGGVEE